MQFGSGWWFLDQKEGIEWQVNALSNAGLLAHFVGMITDSRSFMSFPRHEYFRRVLCNLVGRDVEIGRTAGRPRTRRAADRGRVLGECQAVFRVGTVVRLQLSDFSFQLPASSFQLATGY